MLIEISATCTGISETEDSGNEEFNIDHWSYVGSRSATQSVVLKCVPLCSYVTVTDSHGDRVYLRLKSEREPQATQQRLQSALQLLTVPLLDLKDNIKEEVLY